MPLFDADGVEVEEYDAEPEVVERPAAQDEAIVEASFVANILARPDLVDAVSPDPRDIADPTVRAMLYVIQSRGAAYAAPGPMMAALTALPYEVNGERAMDVLSAVPEAREVELGVLLALKDDISKAARDRRFASRTSGLVTAFGKRPAEMVAAELRQAIDEYDRGGLARADHTAKGALERLKTAKPKIRYRIAVNGVECLELDEPFPGIGPDGRADYGMSGLGEVDVLAAGYGVGKTRIGQNWEDAFLMQGASVAHIMLEDDETAGMCKLMGIHADLPYWQVEQYARGELGFIGSDGVETAQRLDAALAWYESLGSRIRFYDGSNTEVNIFDFDQCLRLLELDVRLYKTTHIFVDYVQAFGSMEYSEQARYAQQLRAFAGRHKVNVIEVSQVSNDTIKWGSAAGQVAAKGAGDWGQAAHIGIELEWQPEVGQEEICLHLKKARNARRRRVYARVNEATGKILAYYGTPMLMSLPEENGKGKQQKGGRK